VTVGDDARGQTEVDPVRAKLAANRGLAQALGGDGFDIEAAASRTEHDLDGVKEALLVRAQQAGAVRPDATIADVKALLVGCLARERHAGGPGSRARMIAIACAGLRAETQHAEHNTTRLR